MFATAVRTDVYLLLEYEGVWEEKAFEKSTIDDEVKAWLTSKMKELPAPRLLLIRSGSSARLGKIHFFVAVTQEKSPSLYAFQLQSYEDLLRLDLSAIVAGDSKYQAHLRQEPLFIVCTNGRRDPDCARHGVVVFNALADELGNEAVPSVWQSTHVGGHRFATNMTLLPLGLLFGRVDPESAIKVVDSYRRGEVYLPNLRGRVCYNEIVQAGEYFLRQKTGDMGLDIYSFQSLQELTPEEWELRFVTAKSGEVHRLRIAVDKTDRMAFESCRADKQTAITRYNLLDYRENG